MKIAYFSHSLMSCWNHGNAHFLRGVLRALMQAGNEVAAFESRSAWSLSHLLTDHGEEGLAPYRAAYPELSSLQYDRDLDLACALAGRDLVVVHEWNEPWLVAAIGHLRKHGAKFTLLFHDTHHRAVSDPEAIRRFDLDGYDGVLAFGEALARVYRRWGWGDRVFIWHEAADTTVFHPPTEEKRREGLVWIGNWGDGERTEELESFLLRPASDAGLPLDIYGVRYPDEAITTLGRHGAHYRNWLANVLVPEIFARHLATVHVPRRYYVEALPGIPTIRVFEALACGIPLLSAPWHDTEGLFRQGEDYLLASTESEMVAHMRSLAQDREFAASLARSGFGTIRARHSCAHRAAELTAIVSHLKSDARLEVAQ
ncbi:MAG: glycosyltransferase [Hyphomicrobiales bacterium]|nr:glycosyltransferase [Hyphomicrobiales bacterium]